MAWERGQRDLTTLRVGAAVIIGILVLVFGVLWGQDLLREGTTYRMTVLFESGFGLSTGDPVLVAGVKKGQVTGIALTPDNRVAVEMRLHESVHLDTASLFSIESEGLIGSRFINVTARQGGRRIAESDTLVGINGASLNDIFRNMQLLMIRVGDLTASMQAVITDQEVRDRIGATFENFNRTIDLLNQVVVDNQGLVSESLSNLSEMVANVNSVLDANREPLRGALTSVGEAGTAFQQVAARVDSLADTLQDVTGRIAASRGSLWRMAESDTLYLQLNRTLASLDSFITDLRENPKKYFTIRIF
jgi:phospholipid/cholesterol/gamma-HCH transport system substrate-binding protein